jgi:hypothetical protein
MMFARRLIPAGCHSRAAVFQPQRADHHLPPSAVFPCARQSRDPAAQRVDPGVLALAGVLEAGAFPATPLSCVMLTPFTRWPAPTWREACPHDPPQYVSCIQGFSNCVGRRDTGPILEPPMVSIRRACTWLIVETNLPGARVQFARRDHLARDSLGSGSGRVGQAMTCCGPGPHDSPDPFTCQVSGVSSGQRREDGDDGPAHHAPARLLDSRPTSLDSRWSLRGGQI